MALREVERHHRNKTNHCFMESLYKYQVSVYRNLSSSMLIISLLEDMALISVKTLSSSAFLLVECLVPSSVFTEELKSFYFEVTISNGKK